MKTESEYKARLEIEYPVATDFNVFTWQARKGSFLVILAKSKESIEEAESRVREFAKKVYEAAE